MEKKTNEKNWQIIIIIVLVFAFSVIGIWVFRGIFDRAVSPTLTISPTSTRPEITKTPTITAPIVIIASDNVAVLAGPGPEYPLLTNVHKGEVLRVVGRNAASSYLLLLLPDNKQGWISVDAAEFDFDLSMLPIAKPPATPTPNPSSTPTPQKTKMPETVVPYGQGILGPPQISNAAPLPSTSRGRKTIGLITASLISLLIVYSRHTSSYLLLKTIRQPAYKLIRIFLSLF